MTADEDTVICAVHGRRPGGIICRHLNNAIGRGIYTPDVDPASPDEGLQAWCYECDQSLLEAGAWLDTPEVADNFICICDRCFSRVVELNRLRSVH